MTFLKPHYSNHLFSYLSHHITATAFSAIGNDSAHSEIKKTISLLVRSYSNFFVCFVIKYAQIISISSRQSIYRQTFSPWNVSNIEFSFKTRSLKILLKVASVKPQCINLKENKISVSYKRCFYT